MRVDHRRCLTAYRAARGRFAVVDVPPLQHLAVDGHGDPNTSPAYRDAVASLFPVAYALRAASRRDLGRDYVVMPLEGLWWADDLAAFTTARDPSRWRWRLLVMTPDWLTRDDVDRASSAVAARGGAPALDRLRLERLDEGRCVQTLHVGPYDAEGPLLEELHRVVLPRLGLRPTGHHHEVYLGDPRRAAPERLRTILRQPVA